VVYVRRFEGFVAASGIKMPKVQAEGVGLRVLSFLHIGAEKSIDACLIA